MHVALYPPPLSRQWRIALRSPVTYWKILFAGTVQKQQNNAFYVFGFVFLLELVFLFVLLFLVQIFGLFGA